MSLKSLANKHLDALLNVSVFISGAIVMVYELAGSRIVAPYLGNSLTVWTALIGVILAFLSIGYYLGGYLADRKSELRHFSFFILLSSVLIAYTFFIKEPFLSTLNPFNNLELYSVLVAIVLFGPASLILGLIAPYATKLKLKNLSGAGKKVGGVYSLSTFGSIFGTFLAGFYLIPVLGSSNILILLAIIQGLNSLIYIFSWNFKFLILVIMLISLLLIPNYKTDESIVLDKDTKYGRVQVLGSIDVRTGKRVNLLKDDVSGTQSAAFLDSDELVFDYTKFFRIGGYFNSGIKKALMIGGGAFSYPIDFVNNNQSAIMDVVEINPELTAIAKEHFRLRDDERLQIINEDGRTFLNRNPSKYDAIYIDAFKSDSSPPFHLTTKEAIRRIYESLSDDGVAVVNIIGSVEGQGSGFVKAELSTYQSIFPQTFIFLVNSPDLNKRQNIMLVATKKSEEMVLDNVGPQYEDFFKHLHKEEISRGLILTDDYAPVESLMRR
jgi:spermidine synthase